MRDVTLTNEEAVQAVNESLRKIAKDVGMEYKDLQSFFKEEIDGKITFCYPISMDLIDFLGALSVTCITIPELIVKSTNRIKSGIVIASDKFKITIEIPTAGNGQQSPYLYFEPRGQYSVESVKALMEIYVFANGYMNLDLEYNRVDPTRGDDSSAKKSKEVKEENNRAAKSDNEEIADQDEAEKGEAIRQLREMGLTVFDEEGELDWTDLAGCEEQKKDIKKIILNRIDKDHIYRAIVSKTRQKPNPRMPKGVLFYGPGGVGKTLSARIIASQLGIPVVCFKKSQVQSKWVNEGEKNVSEIFNLCRTIGKVVLFVDELEQVGRKRGEGGGIHNDDFLATLLQEIDGVDPSDGIIVLGSTNMKDFIDPPLLQRFTLHIEFFNPDLEGRKELFKIYANHLSDEDIETLAKETDGMPGRAIEYCCEAAESAILDQVSGDTDEPEEIQLPTVETYLDEIKRRNSSSTFRNPIGFAAEIDKLRH
ncbi:MAG: AAA family ATPase [Candidatus Woesearchaeota archaeon]